MNNNSTLIAAAEKLLATVKGDLSDTQARLSVLEQADRVRFLAERPLDTATRLWQGLDKSHFITAIDVVKSLGVLDAIPHDGKRSALDLATQAGVDVSVITRCMRTICVQGIGEEVESNVFAHNEKSLAYVSGTPLAAFFDMIFDHDMVYRKLPEYFASHTPDQFLRQETAPYVWALGHEGKPFYQVLAADPVRAKRFDLVMGEANTLFPKLSVYPFAQFEAAVKAEPDRAFIVDIGGGNGTTLKSIQQISDNGFGAQLVLQDLPSVLDAVKQDEIPGIRKMEQDIFAPQKVKNAHIYLTRRVLHNYSIESSTQILKNVAGAMGPTSRLLICDGVLPDRTEIGKSIMTYWMDMAMMLMTGREKTASEFVGMAAEAGLQVLGFWPETAGPQVIVEMKLK